VSARAAHPSDNRLLAALPREDFDFPLTTLMADGAMCECYAAIHKAFAARPDPR
jgi:hypothetical protein